MVAIAIFEILVLLGVVLLIYFAIMKARSTIGEGSRKRRVFELEEAQRRIEDALEAGRVAGTISEEVRLNLEKSKAAIREKLELGEKAQSGT
jgi:hypothetical protein